jgi:hypothetical protein
MWLLMNLQQLIRELNLQHLPQIASFQLNMGNPKRLIFLLHTNLQHIHQ